MQEKSRLERKRYLLLYQIIPTPLSLLKQIVMDNKLNQHLRQQILNYEIKMIEECSDSLFTDYSCQHERYLCWELGQSLKEILKNYQYKYRWIGNDLTAYIYAYFYVMVIGCANQPRFMIELKVILYDLGQKYLPKYEQKFLIEFLCLIEYSQDRYLFFRKYSRIEGILLKIFKEIEARNPIRSVPQIRATMDQQCGFSKIDTSVSSPKRSQEGSSILRNSDYYNSSMKRIEREYRKAIASKQRKLSTTAKSLFIQWYQIFNKAFYFLKMRIQSESTVRMRINFINEFVMEQEYLITVEKGCFFVIELTELKKDENPVSSIEKRAKVSENFQTSKTYLKLLIQKQFEKTKILNHIGNSIKNSGHRPKTESNNTTPKFITDKMTAKFDNQKLYGDSINQEKKVQIEVLQVSRFDESQKSSKANNLNSSNKSQQNQLAKEMISVLSSDRASRKSLQDKKAMIQQIKSHPLFAEFASNGRKAIETEQNISTVPSYPTSNHCKNNDNLAMQNSKTSIENRDFLKNKSRHPLMGKQQNKNCSYNGSPPYPYNGTRAIHMRINPEIKNIYPRKITGVPANQTMLSANILRKTYKNVPQFRVPVIMKRKNILNERPFYSNSPPSTLTENRNRVFSPSGTPFFTENSQHSGRSPPCGVRAIKFTYI